MVWNTSDSQQIPRRTSLEAVLKMFLLAKETAGMTKKSIKYYRDEINRFVIFAAAHGILSIEEVTPDLIRQFLVEMAGTRNRGGVHATWRPLRAMFHWYEAEYEPDDWKNPARKVHIPSPRPKPIPGITIEDYQKLIAACEGRETGIRDVALFYCLLDTCARASEFVNMDITDVDLITGDVLIRHGKGGKPRYVNVGTKSLKALRKYLKTRNGFTKSAPLFLTKNGERFTYDGLASLIRLRCLQAGIDKPSLHDIRRAGALELLRNGADISEISIYLGHESVEVTMRYLAITSEDLRRMHRRTGPVDHL